MRYQFYSQIFRVAHNIAKIVKRVNKDIVTVLGGNHISSAVSDYQYSVLNKNSGLPNEIQDLENEHFDLAMIGEGEFSVLELCQKIMNKQDISKVPGLVKKINKKKYLINAPQRIHDLNILPQPARIWLTWKHILRLELFIQQNQNQKEF